MPGLAISPNTIVYYYTYGSVLSALSRPRDNKCGEALRVMNDVRVELRNNPDNYIDGRDTILSIVQAGEAICASLANGDAPASPVPSEAITSTPVGDVMPQVTTTP